MKIDRKDYEKTLPILAKKIEELEKKSGSGATISLSTLGVIATATELNYVKGVTSSIQTQLDGKVPTSRTINGKALTGNIKLSASDVGASASDHNHDTIYAKIDHTHTGYAPSNHNHDTVYSKLGHSHTNYVDLTSAQTITAAKTFNGEQKFYNASYCPTITDSAGGVGCAFKASRGLFNEALIDKLIMTGSTGKIPFYKYTGTSGGSMTGLSEVASISSTGEVISRSANAFRSIQGNYGFILRNDGSNLFFMFTNSGDSAGNWNSLRPFTINCATGKLSSSTTYNNTTTYATNMYVGSSGMIYRTTNTSSRTIKHDIKELSDEDLKAENLYNLNVVQFKYDDGIITDEHDARYGKDLVGFIIENMNEVYPIAVDKPTDNVKEWSWNTQYLIPPMLKLIQDLHKEVEALKGKAN